jgi:hypothetical protein
MSDHDKGRGPFWPLDRVYRRTRDELRGEHGGPGRTAFARIVVRLVVLMFGGGVLWSAVRAIPLWFVLLVAAVIVARVLYRRWQRQQ